MTTTMTPGLTMTSGTMTTTECRCNLPRSRQSSAGKQSSSQCPLCRSMSEQHSPRLLHLAVPICDQYLALYQLVQL